MDEGFENEKLAPGLSVALEINKRFGELYPFDGEENGRWELLVKYNGDLKSLEKLYDFQAEELLFGYAIFFFQHLKHKPFEMVTFQMFHSNEPKKGFGTFEMYH